MMLIGVAIWLSFAVVNAVKSGDNFPWSVVNSSLWLSDATYCPTNSYLNRSYVGASEGFVASSVLLDTKSDTNGYMGYYREQQRLYVTFRGSSSTSNWISDLDTVLTEYAACTNCYVHKGFYLDFISVKDQFYLGLNSLLQEFPNYEVIITGHSLGAALATLAAMDLALSGKVTTSMKLITFGSPRVGNNDFAKFASDKLTVANSLRITHYRDPIPHSPIHERYTHILEEWYEDEKGNLQECSNGYEDPACAYQWYYSEISDHMKYLGLDIGCKYVSNAKEQKMLEEMNYQDPLPPIVKAK